MGYEIALSKAWDELALIAGQGKLEIRFLADIYEVSVAKRELFSRACNVPAKDFAAILILHYAARKLRGLPPATGAWIDFREFSGVEGYQDAFHKRCVEPLTRKYGTNPSAILQCLARIPGRPSDSGDAGIIIEPFDGVLEQVIFWKQDEEFSPEVNVLFDASVKDIFCTEDAVVMAQIVALSL